MPQTADPQAKAQFGLPERAVSDLQQVFSREPKIQRAIVYGSRAKGNFRPGSDIDITLEAPGLGFDQLLRLETTLDDLMLPYRIDLSLLHHIDSLHLLSHIARVGQVLYQNPDIP